MAESSAHLVAVNCNSNHRHNKNKGDMDFITQQNWNIAIPK